MQEHDFRVLKDYLNELEKTERRYQRQSLPIESSISSVVSTYSAAMAIQTVEILTKRSSYFRLVGITQYTERTEIRSRTVEVDGEDVTQQYAVQVPSEQRLPPKISLDAFRCVDCGSASRFDAYLWVRNETERFEDRLQGRHLIRLARGAIDFGDRSNGLKYLESAIDPLEEVKDSELSIEQSRLCEEAANLSENPSVAQGKVGTSKV